MNLPNKLTLCRVFSIPLFLIFMLVPGIPHFTARLISLLIFILACVTDALDGYICKKGSPGYGFWKVYGSFGR